MLSPFGVNKINYDPNYTNNGCDIFVELFCILVRNFNFYGFIISILLTVEHTWVLFIFASYMLIIFWLFSYFIKFLHKFSSFFCVLLFKKVIFYLIELFPEKFFRHFIFIAVYLGVDTPIDLLANSILCNFLEGCNDTFWYFLIVNLLNWIDDPVRMEPFNHCQISAFYLNIC